MSKKIFFSIAFLMLLIVCIQSGYAQVDTLQLRHSNNQKSSKKIFIVLGSEAVISGTLITGLNEAWYKNYPKSNFHFFNDSREWLQMDKIGHAMTAYYVGKFGIDVMKWSGLDKRNAAWIGGSTGLVFLTAIEVLDGFSSQWGFSSGDLIANAAGSALVIAQDLCWNQQKIGLKFSYSPSVYPQYRSSLLGRGSVEKIIKDYNAQTYWLSVNLRSFSNQNKMIPPWLNLAIGYGADGMLGGTMNPELNEAGKKLPYFERKRQFFLSFDINAEKIKTKNKALALLLRSVGFIKFPLPTIEYRASSGWYFHPIYF